MAATTLTWPLRLAANGRLASTEQGSDEDIESCITCILFYPKGWRDDNPAFGRPPVTFLKGGVDAAAIAAAIIEIEPRATPQAVANAINNGIQSVTVDSGVPNG